MKLYEAKELIRQFEDGTLPKHEWTHKAHFVMALWYCSHQPLPVAIQSICNGIKSYNVKSGGANTEDAGYHETITLFYARMIVKYIFQLNDSFDFQNALMQLDEQPFLSKDFPLHFYSKELLMSRAARKNWTAPDKQSIIL